MKTLFTGLGLLALMLVGGAIAQAPQSQAVYRAPDGGFVVIEAQNGTTVVTMVSRDQSVAQMGLNDDLKLAIVSVQQGGGQALLNVRAGVGAIRVLDSTGGVSELTPRSLVVDGVRRF